MAQKDLTRNKLIVVQGEDHPALFKEFLIANSIHWINASAKPKKMMAKTRYRQNDQACIIEEISDQRYRITFDQPQRAVTPGQSIVFYQDDICLGGGIIES